MYSVKSGFQQLLDTSASLAISTLAIVKSIIVRTCVSLIQDAQLALYEFNVPLDVYSSIRIDGSWSRERMNALIDGLIKEPWTAAAIRDVSVLCGPWDASLEEAATMLLRALLTDDFNCTLKFTTLEITQPLFIQILQFYDWPHGEPRFKDYIPNPSRQSPQAWEDALASKQFKVLQGLDALTINYCLEHVYTPDFMDHTLAGFCRAYKGTLTRLRLVKASHSCPRL